MRSRPVGRRQVARNRHIGIVLILHRAVAGRAALRCLPRRIGKGRERRGAHGRDFIDRAIDGTRVSAVRLLPRRQRVGGKEDGGMTRSTVLRHDVASHQPASPEITRHEAIAANRFSILANSLPSGLRDAANKFAWTRSSRRRSSTQVNKIGRVSSARKVSKSE